MACPMNNPGGRRRGYSGNTIVRRIEPDTQGYAGHRQPNAANGHPWTRRVAMDAAAAFWHRLCHILTKGKANNM